MAQASQRAPADLSAYLTVPQAAVLLGVSAKRVRQVISRGALRTAGKIGGARAQHVLRPADVEAYRRAAMQRDNNGPKLPPGYLSPSDVAASLGVTRQRVSELIHAGRLPTTRFGRRQGIHPDDLAHLLAARSPA